MNKLLEKINVFFSKGEERTLKAKKNIFYLFIIRVLSLPISFILIPLTIDYVSTESYGIWLTISSIVAWMSFFDIGINNGLRNRLTESIAQGNLKLSKKYVSTTYAILCLISISVLIIFVFINYYINWSEVLNTSPALSQELSKVALIVVGYFCFKFVLSTVNIIFLSNQLPAQASFRGFMEQVASLIVIIILIKFTNGSLLNLAYGLCISPLFVLIYYNLALFFGKFKYIAPSFKDIDFSLSKDLMGIGFKFFIIQIAGIIQFQTANFIIIQYFGPTDVTVYNVVFKYFSILTMLMGIFMIPLWSAVTDAYSKKDLKWIKVAEIKYRKIAMVLFGIALIMLLVSNYAYDLWLGKGKIDVSFQVSLFMCLFTVLYFFGGIYCTILNGISALNIQFKASIVSPFVFLITSYILINNFNWGISSIIIASILANFNGFILAPLQYRKIFYSK